MRRLLLAVALGLALSACGGGDQGPQSETTAVPSTNVAPPTTPAPTTTSPPTTAAPTTTTAPLDAVTALETFLGAQASGDLDGSLAMVMPELLDFWKEEKLGNLAGFQSALGGADAFTVDNCAVTDVVSEEDGGGEAVACEVTFTGLSQEAAAALGLPATGTTTAVAREGVLSAVRPATLAPVFELMAGFGARQDPAGHVVCTERDRNFVSTIKGQAAFTASCGEWLAGFVGAYEAQLSAQDGASAEAIYLTSCSLCHGVDLAGNDLGPTILEDTVTTASDEQLTQWIVLGAAGAVDMPAFSLFTEEQVDLLVEYIRTARSQAP